jgi:hypothetical protein
MNIFARTMKNSTGKRESNNNISNNIKENLFGPERDGVTGGWRKLHNEDLHNVCSSPSIIRIIKSRRMRWAGHVARMGGRETCLGYLYESQRKINH